MDRKTGEGLVGRPKSGLEDRRRVSETEKVDRKTGEGLGRPKRRIGRLEKG